MKKFLAAALLAVLVSPAAFANSSDASAAASYDPTTSEVFELEEGAYFTPEVDLNQSQSQSQYAAKLDLGDIIKRVIGGVIAAEVLDRDYGRGGYREQVACFARNGKGQIFRAIGNRPRQVQARAVDKCYSSSRVCRPMGCQNARR